MEQNTKYFLCESKTMHCAKKLSTVKKVMRTWLKEWDYDRHFRIIKARNGWDANRIMRHVKMHEGFAEKYPSLEREGPDQRFISHFGEIVYETGKTNLPWQMRESMELAQ